jgi:hypothetical protein
LMNMDEYVGDVRIFIIINRQFGVS